MDITTTPTGEATAATGPRLTQPLREHDFRLVFAGESISLLGDQFHFVALAWLTLQLTASGLALGTVLTVAAVPRVVFMLVGGALSDRMSPRTLMLASNAIRAVVVGVVAALVLTGNAQLWQLYILAGIFGVVDAFFYPALNTIVPMLVRESLLSPANAMIQATQQLAGLIGPALAGVVIAAVETGPAFAIDAASFAVAAGALVLVHGGRRLAATSAASGERLLATIGSGVAYAWQDPPVRALILLTAAFNFGFTGPIGVGIPYLADERFGGGAIAFGVLMSAFGAGALSGAVLAGSLRRVPQLGAVVMSVAAILGIELALLGIVPNLELALPVGVTMGVGVGFINVRVVSWLQARTPEHMRGRIMSLLMLGSQGLGPFSLVVAGLLIEFGAVSVMFAVAGSIIVVAALAGVAAGVPGQMRDEAAA
jgi:MFS family permease